MATTRTDSKKKNEKKMPTQSSSAVHRRLVKDFTFTGYDIMKDVPPKPRVESEEKRKEAETTAAYRIHCSKANTYPLRRVESQFMSKVMRLRGQGLADAGTRALAVVMAKNNTVEEFDVSDNNVHLKGSKALAAMLDTNDTITDVNLSDNQLGSVGIEEVCSSLASRSKTKSVKMSNVLMCDAAFNHIANLLEVNSSIREIDLSRNTLGDTSAVALGRILGEMHEEP
ncbi:hypothetical protein CAPTEDRAFT_196234 [Capitella teleta]|uniref:Uncharacterized protein n=1 Tax=Capitella teleta TaxID=283909 RepID=R7U2N2_CAPTE|nr:hypothetical protein CAPTEDRAFT_196234 [Capitella teleta]|eukprot:ELU00138.1 hypothetical protein CAPTEDRAFT_196234 [Capitella teleta]